jgi:putative ABC transport system permease protein
MRSRLLLRIIKRQFERHPWQAGISVLGIALGVAIVLAIDLTNASAKKAFQIASETISGDISHQLQIDNGYIDENVFAQIRTNLGIKYAYPVLAGNITMDDGRRVEITGVDPISLINRSQIRQPSNQSGRQGNNFFSLITERNAVFIPEGLNTRGDSPFPFALQIYSKGEPHTVSVVGVIPDNDINEGIITDISTAQDILNLHGSLSRIDLNLNPKEVALVNNAIKEPLYLLQAGAQGNALEQMTSAFRTNLTALSLLAIIIGAFLIFNTMTISVLQRRDQIATMRTLGMVRSELFAIIICEALLLAVIGIMVGTGLGIILSKNLIILASRTLNDLYFIREVESVYFSIWSFVKAILLGFGATLIASWLPLRDALKIAPELTRSRSRLEMKSKEFHGTLVRISAILGFAGLMILIYTDKSIVAGFAGLFFIIMAFACLTPILLVLLLKLLTPILAYSAGLMGLCASRGVYASLSRTQVAVAALSIAISATIGVSIMISSFRLSVDLWLDSFLKADIFVTYSQRDGDDEIPDDVIEQIRNYSEVISVTTSQWKRVWIKDKPTRLNIIDLDEIAFKNYRFKDETSNERWSEFTSRPSVIISEPFAFHNNLDVGDPLEIPIGSETRQFEILGIFTDYSSDQGVIVISGNIYRSIWSDYKTRSLSIYLDSNANLDQMMTQLNDEILQEQNLRPRANRDLRKLSMEIFDRTFAITEVLRILTIIIASMGILGALLAIQMERSKEFAVLRATGLTPWELKKLMLTESGLIGFISGVISIPLGIVMAALLIYVINLRSFGWSMDFILEARFILSAIGLGLIAGFLAGIYPAARMGTTSPALALRDE